MILKISEHAYNNCWTVMLQNKTDVFNAIKETLKYLSNKYPLRDTILPLIINKVYFSLSFRYNCKVSDFSEEDKKIIRESVKWLIETSNDI